MNQNYNQGYQNYNQGQYPYQQPPGGFPPPPPRPPRTWWQRNGLVFGLLLGLGLLIGIGIFAVHYFTKKISDGIHDSIETAAEVSETYTNNQLEYDNLYAIYSSDSQKYAALKRKTDALKSQTETLLAQIDDLSSEFRDTVNARSKGKGFLGGMLVSQHFFIKAGRAHRLKLNLEKYMENAIELTGEDSAGADDDDNYYTVLPAENNYTSGTNWEVSHFSAPPLIIKTTFSSLRSDIRSFEEERLKAIHAAIANMEEAQDKDTMKVQ